ncbi:MAG: hypothetical protein AAFO96_03450 [Bacteroidota bacterium]
MKLKAAQLRFSTVLVTYVTTNSLNDPDSGSSMIVQFARTLGSLLHGIRAVMMPLKVYSITIPSAT